MGLGGAVPDTADPMISIPETKATLLPSIKPATKTRAPVTRKTRCQRARANRRMPMTDSRAPVRSHRRSRHERTGLVARDSPGGWTGSTADSGDVIAVAWQPLIHQEAGTASYSAYTELYASEKPVAVRQGVGLGKDDVPVLGELVVLDAEKVIEHGRDAVQDSLALGEDELALGDDMVHSLHSGCRRRIG